MTLGNDLLLAEMAASLGIGLIYKTSFDKANRTSLASGRGLGLEAALPILAEVREEVRGRYFTL